MEDERLKQILEAALLACGRPLSVVDLERLFEGDDEAPTRDAIRRGLAELADEWAGRSLALQEVASGFRAQVRAEFEPWLARLWEEKPPRYSRALLETLAIIAYRQPITRSEIEDIRGVSVSTQIMRTLDEREWVRVVGHRDTPGRPAMYGTTRQFLDHFNLKTLDQLPPLSEIRELDAQYPELGLEGEPATVEPAGRGPGAAAGAVGDTGDDAVAGEETGEESAEVNAEETTEETGEETGGDSGEGRHDGAGGEAIGSAGPRHRAAGETATDPGPNEGDSEREES